tara:strand:- start:49 stop:171 length:123 start_codon:yes stop_codon:yes gene_type:complete
MRNAGTLYAKDGLLSSRWGLEQPTEEQQQQQQQQPKAWSL